MKKIITLLVLLSIFTINAAPVFAEEDWSSLEYVGTRSGVEISLSYKSWALYGSYGILLKFVNNNSFPVNIDYRLKYTCEKEQYGIQSTGGGGLVEWLGAGDSRTSKIESPCGFRGFLEEIGDLRLDVKRSK